MRAVLLVAVMIQCSFGGYNVTKGKIGELETMIISNDIGESVEIVTDFGGRVESLYLRSRTTGILRDVLLGHHGDAEAILENKFWKGMLLIPYANRIAYGKYMFFNGSYTLPLNDPPRQNSLHGFMDDKPMDIQNIKQENDQGSITGLIKIDNQEQGYPFSLNVVITYTMSQYGLAIEVQATNINGDGTPLPFYMGWHPYFNCTAYTSYITLDPSTKWGHVELNANMDPTGIVKESTRFNGSTPIGGTKDEPTFFDDDFKALFGPEDHYVTLHDTASDQSIQIVFSEAFQFVHIYTGSSTAFKEDGIVIEPMSGMADAYNNHDGLTTISDGQTWSGNIVVTVD